ncbi:E3 ubiquitin-protein ligase TRIM41-like, partial [Pseudonaja textilis]|uniref:E3 ubiquitin-protein ligase TRIM41-like n=1 Tax=Pseudonaja textilis TaxID=8673 RepID=UPI000EA9F10C
TLESGLQLQEVHVTLDPDTTHPDFLKISEDRKSVTGVMGWSHKCSVLGCQMFSSGRHFWDVIVGGTRRWNVGVTSKPVNFKRVYEETRQWWIVGWEGKYMARSPLKSFDLVLSERPTRIRISLNCEGGQVSVFDARTAALLHTFSDASLVGETLLPYFCLHQGSCVTLP